MAGAGAGGRQMGGRARAQASDTLSCGRRGRRRACAGGRPMGGLQLGGRTGVIHVLPGATLRVGPGLCPAFSSQHISLAMPAASKRPTVAERIKRPIPESCRQGVSPRVPEATRSEFGDTPTLPKIVLPSLWPQCS